MSAEMKLTSDQKIEEFHRQERNLTNEIRELLTQHSIREEYPMLNAVLSGLAQNIGEQISQIPAGDLRESFRLMAARVMAEAEFATPIFREVKTAQVHKVH